MVKLAEYPRTATFAWSHDQSPSLATGTASGTIDANFSSESKLEIWSLLSPDAATPQASVTADAKFNDLDWSHDNQVVAGALDNGTVEFFSPRELTSIAKLSHHTTPVKTVRFNAKQHNVMCSGGGNREILIWDISKIGQAGYTPLTPGTAMTPMDEIYSLAWNQNQSHVFASAGSSGFASIWDLKAKKEVLHLSHTSQVTGQKNQLSIVEWHPNNSTRIATASGSDSDPSILIWDLRNANVPLSVLSNAHTKGLLSLDWCKQDEKLLLSSGRDNTCVLWNPEESQVLTQYPTRGNWCFKTKFAPRVPNLFASASFDNKIEIQTLQNLACELDEDATTNKQQESETEFWNNVSEQDSSEKPVVTKIQAPSWYGNKSPAAQWAFGGKLVAITNDRKGVKISKPIIPGVEKNVMLDEALQSKNFNPIINKRLVQSIDETNEEDWNMLEKLSLDGKEVFLKEQLAFEDEDSDDATEKGASVDDEDDFFSSLNNKFVPEGSFHLETKDQTEDLIKSIVRGDKKKAISQALDQDLLLEALIIALDCDDQSLKQKVKNVYFVKHGKSSSFARTLHSVSENNVDDLVENLDVSQWRYALKAIHAYTPNLAKRNELLVKLGDRVSASNNRQDALLLYLSAQSLDKVAEIWLKEFMGLEGKLKSKKETIYEAHLECLTEFVERFTVFISLISDDQHQSLANEGLISKFLEFVNLTSANGDFDLALKFLNILPDDNEEVITEKQRVMIASNKTISTTNSATTATRAQKSRYNTNNAAGAAPMMGLGVTQEHTIGGGNFPPMQPPAPSFAPNSPFPQPSSLASRNASVTAPVTTALKQSAYAPPASFQAPVASKYAPGTAVSPSGITRVPTAAVPPAPLAGNMVGANPYTPANGQVPVSNAPANPYANRYGGVTNQPTYTQPFKPVANVIGAGSPGFNNMTNPIAPPVTGGATSGQTPHLNKKANDGWNDLPLKKVNEKPMRAKAVSVAPASVATSPGAVGPQSNFGSIPPPPLSRVTSSATIQTPVPQRGPSKSYAPAIGSASPSMTGVPPPAPVAGFAAPSNPYAPPPSTNTSNPYAPPPQNGQAPANANYGPSTNTLYGAGAAPFNGQSAPPPISQKPPIGPPPKSMKRKPHTSHDVTSATAILESVQRKSETSLPLASGPQVNGAPPATAAVSGSQSPAPAAAGTPAATNSNESQEVPQEQQPIVDFLTSELARVAPLIPQEYTKQLKDCNKRLHILFGHLKRQDLLTQPTIDRLHQIVALMKEHQYAEAMQVHVDIATNYAQDAGNWLTGVKRLIGIAEVTSS
ncbi:LANO_0E02080g1_1 [Lachancea nothofagi CBS 11611]|uniref:Protein transport protein SEC31 n=1 Tax=Lachancea nothofagi CBS 11611 TaxID=1266666 RepID=A0A1G4JPT3_9SACH|nr:LANO_0E02080g1_1 [Lachancea nothofagi CBS 11611]